jgi:hypothetical protein
MSHSSHQPQTKKTLHSAKSPAKPRGRSKSPSKKSKKSSKKGKSKSRSVSPQKTNVDPMSKAAMENAYYISHNAPQFLTFRGFSWEGGGTKSKKKGKKKGKKK